MVMRGSHEDGDVGCGPAEKFKQQGSLAVKGIVFGGHTRLIRSKFLA
jgi:hypothetical protein